MLSNDVLALAKEYYAVQNLTAADDHTIQFVTGAEVTYVPIPFATEDSLAGLFTVHLPPWIFKGQEFNIQVRRISSRKLNAASAGSCGADGA